MGRVLLTLTASTDPCAQVVMCGFISFFGRGSVTQLAAGVLWMLLFMVGVTYCRPFVADFADSLKTSVDCAVLVTLVLSMLLKADQRNELYGPNEIAMMMLGVNLALPGLVVLWHSPALCGKREDVTNEEEQRILDIFALLDKSGDGKLSVEELDAFTRATNASCVQDRQVTLDSSGELLKQIDADHDGQVTAKEWSAHPGCRPQPSEHTRVRGGGRGMQSFPCPTTS